MNTAIVVRNAALSLFAAIAINTAAYADWQYTKWGMAVDQVAVASKGQLRPCEPNICAGQSTNLLIAKLHGPYQSGEFKFTAFAMFSKGTDTLASVFLKLDDTSQASALLTSLQAKHGKEINKLGATDAFAIYLWRDAADQIALQVVGKPTTHARVQYFPQSKDYIDGRSGPPGFHSPNTR